MRARLQSLTQYPPQFQLMFLGMLLSTIGASMIWPFLMIYVTKRLELPMTAAASLLSINAGAGLIATLIAGPIADRFGRKGVMVVGLAVNGLGYLLLSQAQTYGQFAAILALNGAFNPLYRVGSDAMLADLIPPEKRPDAYALLRLSNNAGISLGPAMGGFLADVSYTLAFVMAAIGMIGYSLLLVFRAVETLPTRPGESASAAVKPLGGYLHIMTDWPFVTFALVSVLVQMCAVLMWVMMPVYANTSFGVPESQYGWIPTTNALMVVFLQVGVTQITKRHPPLLMAALGALFYGLGAGSVALSQGFGGFWLSMVVMTIGELAIVPTSSTYVANLAPADMRGRYMGIFGLTWGAASGLSPIVGGLLHDNFGPRATWYGGLATGLLCTLLFVILARLAPARGVTATNKKEFAT